MKSILKQEIENLIEGTPKIVFTTDNVNHFKLINGKQINVKPGRNTTVIKIDEQDLSL
jgi:hypothetical protein